MKNWLIIGVLSAVVWIGVRGPELSALPAESVNGLLVGIPTAYLLRGMYTGSTNLSNLSRNMSLAGLYSAVFLRELVYANLDVARRVLMPQPPVNPGVVRYGLEIEDPVAVTVLANSITLTPGTLTLDHDREENVLLIHAIDGAGDSEDVVSTVEEWEALLEEMLR
jgi:Multisubunit Na+/H+ antiporter, MnhE subunit